MKEFDLSSKLRDKLTGFVGFATGRVERINGCIQYCIKPKMGKDGKMPEGEYIDQEQLMDLGKDVKVIAKDTGGDMPDMPNGQGLSKR